MVVLAASICTRGGKPLLSRQFRDLKRDRITALLADFPSLISNSTSQHTTVENEHVRYVYQPLEEFYIVLLTNKTSNILQDIDTLHLFASTVSNMLRSIDEREIFDSAFEILSAFDEIINLGFKENLTLSQVQTFLEMDSHEEKIQEIIERNKELEATEERKRRAKEIQRKELARKNLEQFPSSSFGYDSQQTQLTQSYQPSYQPSPVIEDSLQSRQPNLSKPLGPKGGGLQLGKKTNRVVDHTQPLLSTNNINFHHETPSKIINNAAAVVPPSAQSSQRPSESVSPAPTSQPVANNGILIIVNEKVSALLNRDGSVSQSEIKGDLHLRINDQELSNSKILLKTGDKASGIQYKTHPNVDRNLFTSQGIIGLKDKSKSFPSNDQALGVLRWRATGKPDQTDFIPLLVTAWVSVDGGIANVTLEYELTSEFLELNLTKEANQTLINDLEIVLPITSPYIDGDISYEVTEDETIFNVPLISTEECQGSFEFTIPVSDEDALFPIEIRFNVTNTSANEGDTSLGKVQVLDVVLNNEDEESLPFDLHMNMSSERYLIS
ncbi:uncharacterized protein PRCAT00002965001 [Priceomyces carsonii]|uniref:uncharacterized protein n=1 Tax=Priceomyces carsonii TaxID=28549 RepID=UPI002ED824A0|nr:unnamed protein product [Priceomyces carsonii]